MAYQPVDRSFTKDYLKEQHEAIRWLYELGLSTADIRELRWGAVDEAEKVLKLNIPIAYLILDGKTGDIRKETETREFKISLRNHEHSDFLLKSRVYCPWMFTRERPRTWRREGSKESLYSLPDIREICGKPRTSEVSENVLTKLLKFGKIDISKLNITNLKNLEARLEVSERGE